MTPMISADHLAILALGWGAFAAAAIAPGPNLVAVASRALGAGRGAALRVAAGVAAGAFGWAMLTALGLGALFEAHPNLLGWLALAGGGYLLWLGAKGWRAALTGQGGEIAPAHGSGPLGDALHGLTVTATNPKVALLWAALSMFVAPAVASWSGLLLFATGAAVTAFAIYGGYGLVFSAGGVRRLYHRFARAAEAVFGTAFAALGAAMIAGR